MSAEEPLQGFCNLVSSTDFVAQGSQSCHHPRPVATFTTVTRHRTLQAPGKHTQDLLSQAAPEPPRVGGGALGYGELKVACS